MTKLNCITDCPLLPVVKGVEVRHCCGFIGYAVDSNGNVWSAWVRGGNERKGRIGRRWRKLQSFSDGRGYRKVRFYNNGPRKDMRIAALVATAFHGFRPEGKEVCHNDGRNNNDHASNLRWDTHSNNMKDAVRHKTLYRACGELHPMAKLTDAEASMVRTLGRYLTLKKIAGIYNISQSQACNIVNKKQRK